MSLQPTPQQDPATLDALPRRVRMLVVLLLPFVALSVYLVFAQMRQVFDDEKIRTLIPSDVRSTDAAGLGHLWTSTEATLPEEDLQVLETRAYVMRTYVDMRAEPVALCLVFSEDNRKGTHPPDVCLEGAGRHIDQAMHRAIPVDDGRLLAARELVVRDQTNGQLQYFCYFYKCGNTFTDSFYWQQLMIIANGFRQSDASGALIRFSTPMRNTKDLDRARARVDEILRATFPAIRDNLTLSRMQG